MYVNTGTSCVEIESRSRSVVKIPTGVVVRGPIGRFETLIFFI
jgi:hypothetical protein